MQEEWILNNFEGIWSVGVISRAFDKQQPYGCADLIIFPNWIAENLNLNIPPISHGDFDFSIEQSKVFGTRFYSSNDVQWNQIILLNANKRLTAFYNRFINTLFPMKILVK